MDRLIIGILIFAQQSLMFLINKYQNYEVIGSWYSAMQIVLLIVNIFMIIYALFCFYETIRTGVGK